VLVLEPVIDTATAAGFALWPAAAPAHASMLHVSANMSVQEVGAVMAALHPHGLEDAKDGPSEITSVLRAIAETECLMVPGGLLARDTETGVRIPPSCCCGLEDWREWVSVPSGGQPWLGHSPAPWVEHRDGTVRVWPDGGMGEGRPAADRAITAPLNAVATQLHTAHQDLRGFLDATSQWVQDLAPTVSSELVAKLDESFQITQHLGRLDGL
jgi:hypothetical protein